MWLGIEGAALLRAVVDGDDSFVTARLKAIRALSDQLGGGPSALSAPVPELDVEAGYEAWAPAIAELARVVRPGGRVVVSDAHPIFVLIQGQAAALVWTLERR